MSSETNEARERELDTLSDASTCTRDRLLLMLKEAIGLVDVPPESRDAAWIVTRDNIASRLGMRRIGDIHSALYSEAWKKIRDIDREAANTAIATQQPIAWGADLRAIAAVLEHLKFLKDNGGYSMRPTANRIQNAILAEFFDDLKTHMLRADGDGWHQFAESMSLVWAERTKEIRAWMDTPAAQVPKASTP